ncbi:MAG: carbohydrate-binding domain-containing protein [Paludibacteraceae bacterium]|nr:carbohydrate-binding domain-containing protein [Paludibacteraceae bacterium]
MKKIILITAVTAAIFLLPACNSTTSVTTTDTTTNTGDDSSDFVEEQTWNSSVSVSWSGSTATISELPDGVTATNESGYVTITSTVKNIEYVLSGSGSGQLKVYSDYKYKLTLNSLTLTCSNGPAINNQSSKSLYLVLDGSSTLSDGSTYADSSEDQKAALFSEGQIIVTGDGSLTVNGNFKHAIASDDYIRIREGELTLKATGSDGLHANDGIIINGGSLSINAASEGIQCDTSSVVITAGTVNITAAGDKGILAYSSIDISGGTITIKSVDKGIKSKAGNISVSSASIDITTSGDDGKGILAKLGQINITSGVINVNTVGSSAKGIKAQGNINISGGTINVICEGGSSSASFAPQAGPGGGMGGGTQPGGMGGGTQPGGMGGGTQPGGMGGNEASGPEGIESKSALTISGGTVYAQSSDDAINSGGDLTITDGYVCAYSTGNDGMDANGDCYIKGGIVYAIAAGGAEVGIDANSEERKQLTVSGGSVVAIGGLEKGSSVSIKSTSATYSNNTWYALYDNSTLVFAFKTPASGANSMTVCTKSAPTLTSGVTVSGGTTIFNGMGNINGTVTK